MSTGAQHILSVVEPEAQPELFGVDKIAKGPAEDAFTLGDWSIDEYRPIKVAVIGAGFSGILAGIRCANYTSLNVLTLTLPLNRFRQYIPNVSLTIYDKNAGVGGTWYSNRYPYVVAPFLSILSD